MACDPLDAFRYATEDLSDQISRTPSYDDIWMELIERGIYPKNVGTNRSVFAIGNIEPTSGSGAWTAIDLSNQLGSAGDAMDTPAEVCEPTWTDINWGYYEGTYGPEAEWIRGPEVCRAQLDFAHAPDEFLSGYIQEITKYAKRTWSLNYQFHHVALSRKAIAVTDFEAAFYDQTALTGMTCPLCELTQEMLDFVAERLYEDGATNPDSNGYITWDDGGMIWPLYIGANQSRRLLRQNAELRRDYRFADPQQIIARVGAKRVIGNFRHIINQRPQRYTCSGGTFTEVLPFVDGSGGTAPTKGTAQVRNPLWATAPYEKADVLSPYLFKSEVVQPTQSVGGVSFDPTNYMADWQFITGAYKWDTTCVDPLGDKGRHFGRAIHAARPNLAARWKYAYAIFFKRCLSNRMECTSCSS